MRYEGFLFGWEKRPEGVSCEDVQPASSMASLLSGLYAPPVSSASFFHPKQFQPQGCGVNLEVHLTVFVQI
jgi:hypothetical protein